jgi:hypothetical protein
VRLLPGAGSRVEQKFSSGRPVSFAAKPRLCFVVLEPAGVPRRAVAALAAHAAAAREHALAADFALLFAEYGRAPARAADFDQAQLDRSAELMHDGEGARPLRRARGRLREGQDALSTSEEFRVQARSLRWAMRCRRMQA